MTPDNLTYYQKLSSHIIHRLALWESHMLNPNMISSASKSAIFFLRLRIPRPVFCNPRNNRFGKVAKPIGEWENELCEKNTEW